MSETTRSESTSTDPQSYIWTCSRTLFLPLTSADRLPILQQPDCRAPEWGNGRGRETGHNETVSLTRSLVARIQLTTLVPATRGTSAPTSGPSESGHSSKASILPPLRVLAPVQAQIQAQARVAGSGYRPRSLNSLWLADIRPPYHSGCECRGQPSRCGRQLRGA